MGKKGINIVLLPEIILSFIFLIVGLGFYIESRNIVSGFMQVLGADVYPKTIALALIICSALAMIKIVREQLTKGEFETKEKKLWDNWKEVGYKLPAMWILLIAYVNFVRAVGYFETGFLFLTLSMFILGEKTKKWFIKSVGISVAVTAVSYIVFINLLNIYLPNGILFKM